MILNDYNTIIRENFDISDTRTRKYIVALEDSGQTQLLTALSNALYDKIVKNVDKIDFGSIPKSKGDITKVDGFSNTVECLNIMRNLVSEYKQDTKIIDTVLVAIENTKSRKAIFMKAYALNVELPIVLYNTTVLAIEQSVSFLIATCIQYIKDPDTDSLKAALDKVAYNNAKDNLMYNQLEMYNKSCLTKEFDDVLNNIIKTSGKVATENCQSDFDDMGGGVNNIIINVGRGNGENNNNGKKVESPFKKYESEDDDTESPCPSNDNNNTSVPDKVVDDTIAVNGSCSDNSLLNDQFDNDDEPVEEVLVPTIIGATLIGLTGIGLGLKGLTYLIKFIIPYMRNLVYFFISFKVKISDTLALQAQFIEANAYKLKYSNISSGKLSNEEKKEKVVKKQLKWAEILKKWSNVFAIDSKKAQKDAEKMSKEDEKKNTIDDIKDQLPPDGGGIF